MLTFLSGTAALILSEWLLLTAWLSKSRLAWQYNLWAMLVILLWAQPWSRSDPYHTGIQWMRWLFYFLLVMATFAFFYVFGGLWPLLVILEILILAAVEGLGRRSLQRD